MTAYLLAGPAEEPVPLAAAKLFLRLDDDAEDALVATLISAARLHIEAATGRALVTQSWRQVLDCWPAGGLVRLGVGPVVAVTAATAYDADGTGHTLPLDRIVVERGAHPPVLQLLPGAGDGLPALRSRAAVKIDFTAGYGTEADAPADLRTALLLLVAYWFEHRDAVSVAGADRMVPAGFDRLLAPYKRVAL